MSRIHKTYFKSGLVFPQATNYLSSSKCKTQALKGKTEALKVLPSTASGSGLRSRISSVQSLRHVWLFAAPWTVARQASLFITNSRSLLKLMSIELVMSSNHLILCHPFLLLPSVFPSRRIFSNEPVLCIRWPKYWSFSFSISPSSEYSGLMSFRMDWLDLLSVSRVFCNTVQKH